MTPITWQAAVDDKEQRPLLQDILEAAVDDRWQAYLLTSNTKTIITVITEQITDVKLRSSESSQGKLLYHQHDNTTEMQMAWACSPTWCVIARHSRRQDDWETYERDKETTADEQYMRGIRNSKETRPPMYVMCLSDGSHWPATTAEYQKKWSGWYERVELSIKA